MNGRQIRIISVGVLATVLPGLVMVFLLAPDKEVLLHFASAFILSLPVFLNTGRKDNRNITAFIEIPFMVLLVIWFIYILLRILIIPLSSYLLWFDLAEAGKAEGNISTVFTALLLFFSTVSFRSKGRDNTAAGAAGSVLGLFFLLTVVYRSLPLTVVFILSAMLYVRFNFKIREEDRKNLSPGGGSSPRLSLLPAAAALLLALLFSANNKAGGSILIDRYLFGSLRDIVSTHMGALPLFELTPGTGYGYTAVSAGDRPVLTSSGLFLIEGEPFRRYYLRENIYSDYSEGIWSGSYEEYFLPEISTDKEEFTTREIEDTGNEEKTPAVKITVISDFSSSLLTALETASIHPEKGKADVFTGRVISTEDGGISIALPLVRNESYILAEGAPVEQDEPDPIFYSDESVPPGVKDLAESLKSPDGDPLKTAKKITSYLTENYTYSLDTEPPKGDLAAYFLFYSKKGYCTHFATSFILLYRACGFPARLASGYLAEMFRPENPEKGFPEPRPLTSKRLTGYHSHTWPEIWLPGKGWTTWETTPPMIGPDFLSENDRYTNRGLGEIGREQEETKESKRERTPGFRFYKNTCRTVLILALSFAPLFTLLLIRRRKSDKGIIKGLLRKSGKMGLTPGKEGWRKWALSVGMKTGRIHQARRAGIIIEKALFSREKTMSPRDRTFLKKFCSVIKSDKAG